MKGTTELEISKSKVCQYLIIIYAIFHIAIEFPASANQYKTSSVSAGGVS